jgi:multicomponent Na+:H+ antiporter subunit F
MTVLYPLIASVLLAILGGGIYQVIRGPTPGDRMLASQLFGTTAVAVLVLFAEVRGNAALVDVALVFALLAAVTAVAFVRCARPEENGDDSGA